MSLCNFIERVGGKVELVKDHLSISTIITLWSSVLNMSQSSIMLLESLDTRSRILNFLKYNSANPTLFSNLNSFLVILFLLISATTITSCSSHHT